MFPKISPLLEVLADTPDFVHVFRYLMKCVKAQKSSRKGNLNNEFFIFSFGPLTISMQKITAVIHLCTPIAYIIIYYHYFACAAIRS